MSSPVPIRAGIVCDLLEEHWPSMDLVAEELLRTLPRASGGMVTPIQLRPTMPRWAAAAARSTGLSAVINANRYLDRHVRYPRWLRGQVGQYDIYHVIDHTYAHLVRELPADRTIVTCHDIDAFRSLVTPESERRSPMFRRMAMRVLDGLRRAAVVTCDSEATRDALVSNGLRTHGLVVVRLGVHPTFCVPEDLAVTTPDADVTLLHVGSTITRKRIDLLLQIFARVREFAPTSKLVRVGGPFTPTQAALARSLGVSDAITVMPVISREALAALYRRATMVLLPSEAEGFGLPLVEAMACGTPVVASDLPALREVGGEAASYAADAEPSAWAGIVQMLLTERMESPERWAARRVLAVTQSKKFTWEACAERMAELYLEVSHG